MKAQLTKNLLGESIAKYRKIKGLSQSTLAKLLDMPQSSIGGYESGRSFPQIPDLLRICDALDVSIDEMCGRPTNVLRLPPDKQRYIDLLNRVEEYVPEIYTLAYTNLEETTRPFYEALTAQEPKSKYAGGDISAEPDDAMMMRVSESPAPYDVSGKTK